MTQPLYRQVLGASFDELPPRVRQLHELTGPTVWRGRADVTRGTSGVARLLAMLFRLPPDGCDQHIEVRFMPAATHEVWQRVFPSGRFQSRQYASGNRLVETVGPLSLVMTPSAAPTGLSLGMNGARLFGIPLPAALVPRIATREWEQDGRYRFDVAAGLPLIGALVRYAGWLEPVD